jgi:hypothetical protein
MRWSRLLATTCLAAGLAACSGHVRVIEPQARAREPAPPVRESVLASSAVVDPAPSAQALADARHVLNRLAFGPRPGEVERVARAGPERWIDEQLAEPPESPLLEAALVPHRSAFAPPAALIDEWLGEGWENQTHTDRALRRETRPYFAEHLERLATAELTRDILSRRQLQAVMTDFWANHFNVLASKGFVRLFEGDYLERAIRPHALGKFSELLIATARHPAMLLYLDNAESRRRGRRGRGGLNENYARELLELHTLGVDGGYTQADVTEVARILTGWSVARVSEGGFDFVFRSRAHDRGEKLVLGEPFPAGQGQAEGVRLLELLARQPATARHLAQRLCARFVADEPAASCVSAASAAYIATDGDIKSVLRAITQDPSFWAPSARRAKLKTPLELLASAARALDAQPDGSLSLAETMDRLGEPLLQEQVPTGYPDGEPEWASAGAMLARLTFASELGSGKLAGLLVPWDEILPLGPDLEARVTRFGRELLGVPADARTLRVVSEQLRAIEPADQRRALAVALLVGSPEFQRQ